MKKTVQIVIVPLNVDFCKPDDLVVVKQFVEGLTGKQGNYSISNRYADAAYLQSQQLLVLSDDEIQEGDLCTMLDSFGNVMLGLPQQYNPSLGHTLNKGLRKTIASYPQLPDTLPLSKETVQTWIDADTPKEGVVEYKENHNPLDYSDVCYSNRLDSQGNLKIEFGKESDIRYEPRLDTRGSVSLECRVEVKPQPDFQAIFTKAKEIADDICKRSFLPTEGDFYEGLVVGIDTGLHICADKNKLT